MACTAHELHSGGRKAKGRITLSVDMILEFNGAYEVHSSAFIKERIELHRVDPLQKHKKSLLFPPIIRINKNEYHILWFGEHHLIVGMTTSKCARFLVCVRSESDRTDNLSPSCCLFCDPVLSWLFCEWYASLCYVHSF